MKKFVVRSLLIIVVLVLLAGLGTYFFLGTIIKRGVETVGPKITKTDVKLNSASLSILSGSGKINGFVLGNPQGFKTPAAISVGTANLSIEPRSLFDNKVIIRDITVDGPEITFETDLTAVNLKKILSNIEESSGGGSEKPASTQTNQPAASQPAESGEGKNSKWTISSLRTRKFTSASTHP